MKAPLRFSFPRRPDCRLLACAAGFVLLAGMAMAQQSTPQKYVAIITSNVSADGVSLKKGCQLEAMGYDSVSGKVTVSYQGSTVKVPASYVRVVPQDKAGITVVHAEYGTSAQKAKNVTALLQRKLDGQQKASFPVSGADFGVRASAAQSMPSMGGSSQGGARMGSGGGAQSMPGGGMPPQGQSGTLTIEYFYNGTAQTVSAADGQTLTIPVQ